jgi:hypothetical protein
MYFPALYKKEKDFLDYIHRQSRGKKVATAYSWNSNNDLKKKRAYNPFPLTCVKDVIGPKHLRDKRDQLMFSEIEGTQSSSHLDDIDVRSTDFT